MKPSVPTGAFSGLPDPGGAQNLDELVERLRSLKVWAGDPSYEVITERVNAGWAAAGYAATELARRGTVVDCFRAGRRLNADLVVAVVAALHPEDGYVTQWRQALRVALGEARAAVQVRAQDRLPADLAGFTGRSAELERLRQLLQGRSEATGKVLTCVIEGMPGVGKTQLAVHAGHLLAAERPFEQVLFVNLRGFHPDPAQPPADPAAVLDSFLRLLGVPGQGIPHELVRRTSLYRQRLAGQRALVILDDAADEDQVRPLLPDSPDCLTLVTSRRRLSGLDLAEHFEVEVFSPEEATDFLTRTAPDVPVGHDPEALVRVARRCAYLPLALDLVVAQMRVRSEWTATDHADRLDERHRAQRLDSGIELALGLSYLHLPADRRRAFRMLALHPGQDLDRYAAAALTGLDLDVIDAHLRQLCADHLLQEPNAGRFVAHDLVRAYAGDRVSDEERVPERSAALTRLFDHYLYGAATAVDVLYSAESTQRPRIPVPTTPVASIADATAALAWLDTERPNLTAVVVHAANHDWPEHAARLATTLHRYIWTSLRLGDAEVVYTHASAAAHRTGDRACEALVLNGLGGLYWSRGRHDESADHYRRALALYRELGDRSGEARMLGSLGNVHWGVGRYPEAIDHHRQALSLFRMIGDWFGESRALANIATVGERLGRYAEGMDDLRDALKLCREFGDRPGEAQVLTKLARLEALLDHHAEALDGLREALALCRETGTPVAEANVLTSLGMVYQRSGDHRQAAQHHRQALALYEANAYELAQSEARNNLGKALLAGGELDEAQAQHTTALTLAVEHGDLYEQGLAQDGLGSVFHATGEPDRAVHHWRQALVIFTRLGVPEREQVGAHLAVLAPDVEQLCGLDVGGTTDVRDLQNRHRA